MKASDATTGIFRALRYGWSNNEFEMAWILRNRCSLGEIARRLKKPEEEVLNVIGQAVEAKVRTWDETLETMKDLSSRGMKYGDIARKLNDEGYTTKKGKNFTSEYVGILLRSKSEGILKEEPKLDSFPDMLPEPSVPIFAAEECVKEFDEMIRFKAKDLLESVQAELLDMRSRRDKAQAVICNLEGDISILTDLSESLFGFVGGKAL